ncbi:hypothetical protein [Ruminococcus sp. NK3A76]|uniref:hypothetical protein n=1 Tax=Ruminococcus sp. NK3A76 TaxID=877411 RepID=UPI00048F6C3F|nr:hypothetical protein [Ruminococcus sp. NK3A76]
MLKRFVSSMLAFALVFGGAATLPDGAVSEIESAIAGQVQIHASATTTSSKTSNGYFTISPDKNSWQDIKSKSQNVDCAYSYKGDTTNLLNATASFNIVTRGGVPDISVMYLGNDLLQKYKDAGYTNVSAKECQFNGNAACKMQANMSKDGYTIKMVQILFINNNVLYTITYGSESSVFSKLESEFNKAFKTLKIKSHEHTYTTKVVKPTHTANGYTLHTCSKCGGSYKDTYTDKLPAESLSKAKITGLKNKYYSGKAIKQTPVVKLGGKTLKEGTDYTVSYKNNKAIGTATVTVKGKGAYKSTAKATFKIVPRKTAISKVTSPKTKQLKVIYSKVDGVTGYMIAYSTSSKFTKDTTKTACAKKTAKTITKLKKGKTYYVKVRTYKTVDGKKYYSGYSDVKKIKVK